MFNLDLSISENDIIPPYMHVHHADLLKYFERAREGFVRELGFPLDQFLDNGLFIVVASLEVVYKREVKLGSITVTCEDHQIDRKRLRLRQRILNQKGKEAVCATIAMACFSQTMKRAIEFPEDFVRAVIDYSKAI